MNEINTEQDERKVIQIFDSGVTYGGPCPRYVAERLARTLEMVRSPSTAYLFRCKMDPFFWNSIFPMRS
jgi:hypothetical protein